MQFTIENTQNLINSITLPNANLGKTFRAYQSDINTVEKYKYRDSNEFCRDQSSL